MSYCFIKNDKTSFAQCSRVYEVYNFDNSYYLRTALVVGYLPDIEKYFITILGNELLYEYYNLEYKDIGSTEFIKILNEFFKYLSFMDPDDFLGPEFNDYYNDPYRPSLLKQNFILYTSDIEPYSEEEDEHNGIWSTTDKHSNYLLDNHIIRPWMIENYDTDKYERYNLDRIIDLYNDGTSIALYCTIDYELLNTYAL